ncbi:class I adenylate-forming enzyme family protein [Minwuia sp.]|uniref:class I adenylate-forming enzyme family protein n=1 Tax=Minwuia sp. TaxID=2493630 RepID=UPI003A9511A9
MTRDEALAQLTGPGQEHELVYGSVFGRPCRVFKNAPATLRDLYADNRSDLPFLVYGDARLSFEQAWQAAMTLAHRLVDDFGVRPGDRVAISMRNYPEWIIAFKAVTSIGAIAVAMNAHWQSDEMAFALNDCRPSVLVADRERLERLAGCETVPDGLRVIAVRADDIPASAVRWDDLMAGPVATGMPDVPMQPDDDAIMLYTSGSTGYPKGAVSCHRNVITALMSWELDAQAGVLTGALAAPDPDAPQGAALLGVPLFHATGSHANYLSCYRAQRRLICMYRWDVVEAARLIEQERATMFIGPSAMTGDLVNHARATGKDLSSLTTVGGGGAARAPEQVRGIREAFANAQPNTGWGMTETNAIGCGVTGPAYLQKPASSGRCSAVLDMRIVGDDGSVLPTGERGELQVRGTSIFRGYWNRPDANAATFDGDWLKTGDVAWIDDEGFVFIVDRIKDMVIRGGENIGCGAVEAALLEHDDIVEAAVYAVPDARLVEEVGATLYVRASLEPEQVRDFLSSRLAQFQIPRYMQFRTEPLPRTASGKILKRELRDEAVRQLGL